MRFLFTTIVLYSMVMTNASAQNELRALPNNECGLNINALASNFLSFQDETEDIMSLENLVYFKTGKEKLKFRAALNYGISNTAVSSTDISNSFLLLKLGAESKRRLTKAWTFNSGLEFFGFRSQSKLISQDPFLGEFTSTQTTHRLGASFIYGIQVSLSERIALGTEGYIFLSFIEEELRTEDGQSFPGDSTNDFFNLGITLPKSLLLSYYF